MAYVVLKNKICYYEIANYTIPKQAMVIQGKHQTAVAMSSTCHQ